MMNRLMLTLRTNCGCVGQGLLEKHEELTWDADRVGIVEQAIFSLVNPETMEVVDIAEIDGDAWRVLEEEIGVEALQALCVDSGSLAEALSALELAE